MAKVVSTARQDGPSGSAASQGTGGASRSTLTIPVLPPEVLEAAGNGAKQLAQYILVRELGQGGSGTVYAAWDRKLGRWAAIKVLNQITEENAARFLREAQMASRLSHPNIVPLYEASEAENGRPFLAMKLVSGRQLSTMQLDVTRACAVMRDVADAVQYAHDNGVVHRDLKPQNLMLDDAGHVWILDFGLAHSVNDGSTLTAVGAIVGTPAYMPPEQARGGHCDERSDVYSLGATLYALLSGRAPFEGENPLWVMTQVLADDPPPLRSLNERVARDIETIVHKAMRREPSQRFERARDFADDLRRHERGEAVSARPLGPAARFVKKVRRNRVAAVVIAGLVLGAGAFGVGALRYAADMQVKEQATAEARALAEARLKEAQKNLRVAEENRAQSIVEEGNALGASGQWQEAAKRYETADTMFKGLGVEDLGPNAGVTDVLMHIPPPVWSEPGLHAGRITEMLLSRDEKEAYTSSLDGTVKIFSPRTRQVTHTFELGTKVWSLALNPDGNRLAAATEDGRVVVWDLSSHRQLATFSELGARVRTVTFSPDGAWITAGYLSGTVVTWELKGGRLVSKWKEPDSDVRSVVYFGSNGVVAVGLSHQRLGPWATLRQVSSGRLIQILRRELIPSGVRNLAVDESTGQLFAAFGGGFLSKASQTQPEKIVTTIRVSANISVNGFENVMLLNFNGSMQLRPLTAPSRVVFSVQREAGDVGRPGRHGRVLSADVIGGVKLWSAAAQPAMGRVSHQQGGIGVQLVLAGEVAVVEHVDGVFVAIDRGTAKQLWTVKLPVPRNSYSNPSPKADLLATADQDGALRVFSVPTGELKTSIQNEKPPRFLKFSPDEQWLGATFDHNTRIWNVKTGELVADFDGLVSHRMISWLPDGKHVVIAKEAHLVSFDLVDRKTVKSLPYPEGWKTSDGYFHESSNELVVGFNGRGVIAYDWNSAKQRTLVISDRVENQVAPAGASSAIFVGESNISGEVGVALWDTAKHHRVHVFASGSTAVAEPHLPQDVPLAASVNHAGDLVVWDLSLPTRFAKAADHYDLAIKRTESPSLPKTNLALARYYSLRGLNDWALEEFDAFVKNAGGLRDQVSVLEYGRALWLGGRFDDALVQYRLALKNHEAEASYLNLCITAIERESKGLAN